jgi:hypothetical protein
MDIYGIYSHTKTTRQDHSLNQDPDQGPHCPDPYLT